MVTSAPIPPDDVAPDGSPVAVYLAMPPHDALELVADQVPPGGSVLDLGCGVGRLANPLADRGCAVTGVDEHPGMLTHLSPAVHAVEADAASVDLGRTFDVVILASHLVNHARLGQAFLATCRRHVDAVGCVLVERFHPDMLDDPEHREGVVDGVGVRHVVHQRDGTRFAASALYTVGAITWEQRYDAVILDDDAVTSMLEAAGLSLVEWVDHDARWALAHPSAT